MTSLAAAFALLIVGCGGDPAPEDPGLPFPEPELSLAEPEFAAAVATTNVWTTKAPMPAPRFHLAAGIVNGVLYAVGGTSSEGKVLTTMQAYSPGSNS